MDFENNVDGNLPVEIDIEAVKKIISELLGAVGEDPGREGLKNTPDRVARMYSELLSGYRDVPEKVINGALFDVQYDEMVIVRDIEFYSMCEHHMLPFIGRAHVAYIPNGKVLGLSKIPRIVDMYARRLQVQERMTREIAHDLQAALKPRGVAVRVEARHLCMAMRGVEQKNADVVTVYAAGVFKTDPALAEEFRAALAGPRR
jgi:GTP cyclohydrolase I